MGIADYNQDFFGGSVFFLPPYTESPFLFKHIILLTRILYGVSWWCVKVWRFLATDRGLVSGADYTFKTGGAFFC